VTCPAYCERRCDFDAVVACLMFTEGIDEDAAIAEALDHEDLLATIETDVDARIVP
jgi:hypothetical protein